jgi:hypothetical protein
LLILKLPLLLFLQLLLQFELPLLGHLQLILLLLENVVEAVQLLADDCEFVLEFVDSYLVTLELHYRHLELLAALFQLFDLAQLILQVLAQLADFVFEVPSFSLVFDCELTDLAVKHTLPLTLHHQPQIVKLFGFALF